MQLSLFGSTFLDLSKNVTLAPLTNEPRGAAAKGALCANVGEASGFNVHAGVTIRAGDREGLERLLRYCARPPFSLERLTRLGDGRVAYLLRKPRRNGATHLVMTPVQFLARLAALIPPPRYPLVRFSGVLAPRSSWRAAVVPKEPPTRSATASSPSKKSPSPSKKKTTTLNAASTLVTTLERSRAPENHVQPGPRTSLGDGVVRPVGARIDWANLLRRVYLEDVLSCPCGGRRSIIADIVEPDAVAAILSHLGLPAEAPPIARARSPSDDAA